MTDRRARRHEETRQEILAAAWTLAREQGLTGWSLREVAAAVDMRAPSLYGYFDSKDAIYDAMFTAGYRELLATIDATERGGDDVTALTRTARAFIGFCVADAARFQLLFLRVIPGFTPSPAAYGLAEEVMDRLRDELATAGITDARTIDLCTALTTGLASQQLSNEPGGQRWTRLVDDAVALLLARTSAATAPAG